MHTLLLILLGAALAPTAGASANKATDSLKPPIHTRREWRAEIADKIMFDKVKERIVVHHTAFYVTDAMKKLGPQASWKAAVNHAHQAQRLHKHIRGWNDVGYHYMIDWNGRILEGRPVDRLGSHTERNNRGSIGVVLMGDFARERPTGKQLAGLKTLMRWLIAVHGISAKNILGHHHLKYTACPGKYLNDPWDSHTPLQVIRMGLIIDGLNSHKITRK